MHTVAYSMTRMELWRVYWRAWARPKRAMATTRRVCNPCGVFLYRDGRDKPQRGQSLLAVLYAGANRAHRDFAAVAAS
jgi:hypothetical protein